jgi:hypothetical protein
MSNIISLLLPKPFQMKSYLVAFALFVSCSVLIPEAKAQLAVSMQLDRQSYILYEHVFAKVTFRNYSGRGLIFGKNKGLKGRINFKIIGPDGRQLSPNRRFDASALLDGVVLNPGATSTVVVPLSEMYNLFKAGQYTVRAIISHPMLPTSYISDRKTSQNGFSIFNGIPVWHREVGVPDVLNVNSKEKVKKRMVKILNFYDNNRKYYALMIEDPRVIYGVIRIAEDLEDELPQIQVDGLSRIHIFVQISAKVYSYFIYDLNCRLEEFAHYTLSPDGGAPVLVRDPKEGSVMVVGGKKAVMGKDFIKENPNPVFSQD